MRIRDVRSKRADPRLVCVPRQGAMLVLIALLLILFFVLVAFYVDAAYMQLTRTQLRIATDAAARAAGESLSREQDIDAARAAAIRIAAENKVAGAPLILDDDDVLTGNVSEQEDGTWMFNASGTPVNGMRVVGRRTPNAPSGPIDLFFGKLIDVDTYSTQHQAVVVRLDRDICLVVDRSSSMKLYLYDTAPTMSSSDSRFCEPPHGVGGDEDDLDRSRWAALVDAVNVFNLALLSTEQVEHLAFVSYASDNDWCGASNNAADIDRALTSDVSLIDAAVDSISNRVFNGNTEIAKGIDEGVIALTDPALARPFAAKTMIVMTDGHQVGGRSPVDAARDAYAANIVVHTITFGDGAGISQMQDVADAGNGNHYHAPDEQALKDAFREIALTMPVLLTE